MLKGLPVVALVMGVVLGAGGLAAGLKPGVYMTAEANRRFSASFAKADPYVTNGLVTKWRVREWTTVVGKDAEVQLPPSL